MISCKSLWSTYHVTGNSWLFPQSIDRIIFQGRLHLISIGNQFSFKELFLIWILSNCTKLKWVSIINLEKLSSSMEKAFSLNNVESNSSKVVPLILLRFYKLAILILCHCNNNAFLGSGSSSKFYSWIWKQNIVFSKIIKIKLNSRFRRNYIPRNKLFYVKGTHNFFLLFSKQRILSKMDWRNIWIVWRWSYV